MLKHFLLALLMLCLCMTSLSILYLGWNAMPAMMGLCLATVVYVSFMGFLLAIWEVLYARR